LLLSSITVLSQTSRALLLYFLTICIGVSQIAEGTALAAAA